VSRFLLHQPPKLIKTTYRPEDDGIINCHRMLTTAVIKDSTLRVGLNQGRVAAFTSAK
jgi:hypothetical protein